VRTADDDAGGGVSVRTIHADASTDLAVSKNPIDVWYGDHQRFGTRGEAQRWDNILGNISTPGLAFVLHPV
jgi:hypothetical protein